MYPRINPPSITGDADIITLNAITGNQIKSLYSYSGIVSLFMASDNNNKPTGSNKPTFGALLSIKYGTPDSIVFYSSDNLGDSFNNHKVLAVSNNILRNVSLSYGKSASASTGRFYAAWDQQLNQNVFIPVIICICHFKKVPVPLLSPILPQFIPCLVNDSPFRLK